jgi:hypothetical protein
MWRGLHSVSAAQQKSRFANQKVKEFQSLARWHGFRLMVRVSFRSIVASDLVQTSLIFGQWRPSLR